MRRPHRITISLLCILAVNAIGGGIAILRQPDGALFKMTPRNLAGSPFPDFFVPGLFLLVVLGFGSAATALLLWKRPGRTARLLAAGIGATLLVWLGVQIAIIGYYGFVQLFCVVLAAAILGSLRLPQARTQ
jgi:hypothetical protein